MNDTRARWVWLRFCGLIAAALVLLAALMTYRAVVEGERALDESEAAFDRGELVESLRKARLAASLVAPGADHVDRAFARLIVIARGAEASGDLDLARLAWEAVREASIQGQGPLSRPSDRLTRANENLVRLSTRAAGERPGIDPEAFARTIERDLARATARDPIWSIALATGLGLSVLGLGWLGLRGVRRDGALVRRELAFGGLIALAGAVCWLLAVYRA
jgi:hypothetical protein